jgi:2-polyprenyl-3-methyl-5-hydroxy-6-metoxy-1,4-benzoquinol methylase
MINCGTFEATLETIAALCQARGAPRVLDIGCGTGALLTALAPAIHAGVGIDSRQRAIDSARRRAAGLDNLAFHALPVEQLPDHDLGHFDIILFVGSLEHMADPRMALQAAGTRAHRDSRIAVVAISPEAPHARLSRRLLQSSANPVVAHLGVERLRRVAEQAGLEVERVQPLYRGSRRTRGARVVGRILAGYDTLGGPTCTVILRPTRG